MTKKKPKTFKEDFAQFFEEPSREGLRDILKNNIGETRNCDFKAEWPSYDALSKHILGMANTGGGAIVVGVVENNDKTLEAVGLDQITDKADISNNLDKYLPNSLSTGVEVQDFHFPDSEYPKIVGKRFQVLFVPYNPEHMPYLAKKSGTDIDRDIVYIRREGVTHRANHDELQEILNRRIETGYSTQKEIDLKEHLNQLKILTEQADMLNSPFYAIAQGLGSLISKQHSKLGESYEDFILRLVDKKKKRIERDLDV